MKRIKSRKVLSKDELRELKRIRWHVKYRGINNEYGAFKIGRSYVFDTTLLGAYAWSDRLTDYLLENGADACYKRHGTLVTSLHQAARRGSPYVIERLIEHGADVNAFWSPRHTRRPLNVAFEYLKHDNALHLMRHGAKVDRVSCVSSIKMKSLYLAIQVMIVLCTPLVCARVSPPGVRWLPSELLREVYDFLHTM